MTPCSCPGFEHRPHRAGGSDQHPASMHPHVTHGHMSTPTPPGHLHATAGYDCRLDGNRGHQMRPRCQALNARNDSDRPTRAVLPCRYESLLSSAQDISRQLSAKLSHRDSAPPRIGLYAAPGPEYVAGACPLQPLTQTP